MNNEAVTGRQMKYLMGLFIIGSSLVTGGSVKTGQDGWITIIFAMIFSVPMIFVYESILRLYPGENIFDICIHVFGSKLGKLFCVLFTMYFIHLGSLVLNVFSDFIKIVNMPETPKYAIEGFVIVLCVYMIYNGVSSIGRIAKLMYPFLVISVIVTILVGLEALDFNNLKPFFNTDIKQIFNGTFLVFALPFCELVVFTALFSSIEPKENFKKIFISGLLLGGVILIIANIRNLVILSPVMLKTVPFPSYSAISVVATGEFFTRIEVIIGANLLFAGVIKIAVCCFSSCIGLAKILNISEYKYLGVPVVLIVITLSGISFENTVQTLEFTDSYKYYAFPFQIIMPIIILVTAKIKNKVTKYFEQNKDTELQNENQ